MNKIDFVKKKIKEEFNRVKQDVYEALWNPCTESRGFVLDEITKIIVVEDKISFDNGETFINRREEKQIHKEFDKVEKLIFDHVLNDISTKEEPKEIDKDDLNLEGLLSTFEHLIKVDVLKTIEEQIKLCRELGRKEELLDLLQEKRRILSEIANGMDLTYKA